MFCSLLVDGKNAQLSRMGFGGHSWSRDIEVFVSDTMIVERAGEVVQLCWRG